VSKKKKGAALLSSVPGKKDSLEEKRVGKTITDTGRRGRCEEGGGLFRSEKRKKSISRLMLEHFAPSRGPSGEGRGKRARERGGRASSCVEKNVPRTKKGKSGGVVVCAEEDNTKQGNVVYRMHFILAGDLTLRKRGRESTIRDLSRISEEEGV